MSDTATKMEAGNKDKKRVLLKPQHMHLRQFNMRIMISLQW